MDGLENKKLFTINEMSVGGRYNMYCVVIKFFPSKTTRGTDFVASLFVTDESTDQSIKIQIFTCNPLDEKHYRFGDILFVCNLLLKEQKLALVDRDRGIKFIGNIENIDEKNYLTEKEIFKFKGLRKRTLENYTSLLNIVEIKDIKENIYFDFIGILKDKRVENSKLTLLYFVDYTVSPQIPVNDDGISVLCVKAWDSFAETGSSLDIGEIYKITNIKSTVYNSILVAQMSSSSKGKFTLLYKNSLLTKKLFDNAKIYESYKNKEFPSTNDKFKKYKLLKLNNVIENNIIGIFVAKVIFKNIIGIPFNLSSSGNYCRCKSCETEKSDDVCKKCQVKCLDGFILSIKDCEMSSHNAIYVGEPDVLTTFENFIETKNVVECLFLSDIQKNKVYIFLLDFLNKNK